MATSGSGSSAYVLGVGMTKFIKPRGLREYPEMGYEAGIKAMLDAQINYDDVQHGVACFAYGDSTSGQRVFYQFGMSTIPIINTSNACATGSVGLYLARNLVRSGAVDCVLVVGFEKMKPGSLKSVWDDRPSSSGRFAAKMGDLCGVDKNSPLTAQYFGNAGREYGAKASDFAEIGRISHEHSQRNPYAQFRQKYTLKEVEESPTIYHPLTKLQCSPTSDGSAAAVIVSQRFLDARPHLKSQAILMAGQAFSTDSPKAFGTSAIELVGYDMTQKAARAALREAGVKPGEIKVCELHDCFSTNELVLLDALEFCEPGKAHEMVRRGDITYGGKMVVNPSGGLISKGHPIGATGLAQCAELSWQLRGWANNRLVDGANVALQHNLGLGGAVVINVYKRADAVEARGITNDDADKVRSRRNRNDFALGGTTEKLVAQAHL
ncbi:putative nonspecific lipid-transfer mitochondrial precursor protein [Phaeoacremonium minimum UCRPA7]|uniref:propanoyl-CoA C-acyltransferase n=1 Tax=Phaeoacremonium minimum (strain UCR-PA7) TaxID=1286976 RepID=R8BGN4_PHAM7|nr:putative nonspecific lipid-transfer mitochondrial precursor protein [Phaeoacremonium minimum UCRPA7]EON98387.1 putative nonspecific lipid-transfer mitochondrial precursor protein [Phaeoacremonium minimum UCRPA7]